jgi:hypothetical protein
MRRRNPEITLFATARSYLVTAAIKTHLERKALAQRAPIAKALAKNNFEQEDAFKSGVSE